LIQGSLTVGFGKLSRTQLGVPDTNKRCNPPSQIDHSTKHWELPHKNQVMPLLLTGIPLFHDALTGCLTVPFCLPPSHIAFNVLSYQGICIQHSNKLRSGN